MTESQWKKPKDIEGELEWKHGLSWRDVYFQVSTNTIYLYPRKRKRNNQILHSISLTQIDEISEIGTKFSKRCFKIILKMGAIEQFKCPAKMDSVKVQQLINNLRHAQTFWTDKENLQQRKPGRQRRVTLEGPDETPKSLDATKYRVFFTLWNGEMIGLLVNAASTFTSVYSRLFSFACEPSSCSVCKIRHQSCDLWAVDTTGTARRVRKDEILTDLGKAGLSLFVMEHHQKLLVVHFSDFSYETLPVPAGITAKQILKLDQIASKLNELSCFDPGLFLRYENGKEVQFCMNDNPFKYQEYGKIVARSKRIRLNSLKKSDHEIIAEIRWKEFEEHYRRKKASDIANKLLAGQIRKSSRVDEELCFVDDHFALNNDEPRSYEIKCTTADPRGMQSRKRGIVQDDEGYGLPKSREYITKVGGHDGDDGDHLKTHGDTNTLSVSTCSEPNVAHKLPPDYDVVSVTNDEHAATNTPDDCCPKNDTDVINTADEVTTENLQDKNYNDGDAMRRDSLDSNYSKNNNDVTNMSDCICIQNNQDVRNQSLSDGTINNNDVFVSSDDKRDVTETTDHDDVIDVPIPRDYVALDENLVTSDNSCTTNNDDITSTSDGAGNKDDVMDEKSSNNQLVKSINDDTNIQFLDHENTSSTTEPKADQTSVSCPSDRKPLNPDGSPNSSPNPGFNPNLSPNTIPDTIPDTNPDDNPKTNLKPNPTKSSNFSEKLLIHSQSDGLVFRKHRQEYEENSSHPPVNRTGMRRSRLRSLSDLNVRYSFTSNETRDNPAKPHDAQVMPRDIRAMSEPDLIDKDDVLLVDEVFPRRESSDDSDNEVICRQPELSSFTGPTWTFAKRVEECVRKILNVKNDIPQVEKLISDDLCKVLYELLDHGLKKNFLRISLFSIGSNVWDICQTVCKATNVGVDVIERIKDSIDQKFHIFIRECIRQKILSRWFEVLSSENVQKQIMKFYEPTAVVLEPEHSKAIEHLKLYLDGLDVLKLKGLKARESGQNRNFLIRFE